MDTKTTTHQALLSPGEHQSDLATLHKMAVAAYPVGSRRHVLWNGFQRLYSVFIASGLQGLDIWVDGSFMTSKPEPKDINAVVWIPDDHMSNCTPEQLRQLEFLKDDAAIAVQYGVNLFIEHVEEDADDVWRQWFTAADGHCDSKGFVRIAL
jgi:hypothetical protein